MSPAPELTICMYVCIYVCVYVCMVWFLFADSVEAIYPVHDPVALQDKRVYSLIQYAMKVSTWPLGVATPAG